MKKITTAIIILFTTINLITAQELNQPPLIPNRQSYNYTNNIRKHFNAIKYQKSDSSKALCYDKKQIQLQNTIQNKNMKLYNQGNLENSGKLYDISNNFNTDNILEHISSPLISGMYFDIVVKNNTAYAANDWGIMIFDVTDKVNPVLVNSILLPLMTTYIDIHNNYLFVSGFSIIDVTYIYDISTQHEPVYITDFQETTLKFCIKDNTLFLLTHHYESGMFIDEKLKIFEISNIETPELLSEIDSVKSFELSDNYIYTLFNTTDGVDSISYLKIYDITNTSNPIKLNEIELIGSTNIYRPYLFIEDNYLYIIGRNDMHILNIEDPIYPEILCYFESDGIYNENGPSCIKYNNYLYCNGGLILDVSEPENPQIAGNYKPEQVYDQIVDIFIDEGYLYVANWENGFYILNLSNPTQPEFCSLYLYFDFFHGIYKKDNYAYVTSMNGLTILDVSEPENGFVVGSNNNISWCNDILVENDYAYVVSDYGLTVFDVNTPESPLLLSSCSGGGGKLIKKDSIIFAGGFLVNRLNVYNVSNPNNIQHIGCYNFMRNPHDYCIKDNYLFISDANYHSPNTDYNGGLKVIDISNPENLEIVTVNNPDTTRYYRSIEIKDNYVFMGSNEPGIYVFDVSNPLSPIVYTYINIEQNAGIMDMEIQGDSLYTSSLRGNYIFNISNIDSIKLVSFSPGSESNCKWSIFIDNKYLYEASDYALNIYKLKDSTGNSIFNINYTSNNDISIQNFPNPFKNSTNIKYKIPSSLKNMPVSLNIYNLNGQLIKTLLNNQKQKGGVYYEIIWNGNNNTSRKVKSGIYIIKLDIGDKSVFKKTLLIK